MSEHVTYVHATAADVRETIGRLPREVLRGGEGRVVLIAAAKAVLGKIRAAFIAKAAGGTDEAGDRWAPLSPATVAYSRGRHTRAEAYRAKRPSQALDRRQLSAATPVNQN